MRRFVAVALILVVAVVSGVYAAFAGDMASARRRLAGRSEMVSTALGPVEYAAIGQGEPILAVHGAAGGFDQALDMTGDLAAHGYRVIAPSRFGYLRSAAPGGVTTAMQADAYAQLLDRLGVDQVTVVGISAGAWSSLQFAIRHPERCRALVLLVPADYLPQGVSIRGGALAEAVFNSDFVAWAAVKATPLAPGAMTRTMLGTDPGVVRGASPDERARVRQILEHLLPVRSRSAGMQFDIATAAARERYAIDRISCPVLAISAEDDAFGTATRARTITAAVRDGRAVVYPTGGHALVGRHDPALREIVAFLREGPRPRQTRSGAAT